MEHKEYIRVSPRKDTAVLMIHGILGTPRHFDVLLDTVREDWSIYNILLDGHGKNVSAFSNTSMERWQGQVDAMLYKLSREYNRIFIIAHSMGTLLAIESALKGIDHGKVRAMVLLNVPLKVALSRKLIVNALKLLFGKVRDDDTDAAITRRACSIKTEKNLFTYIGWIPRFLELLSLIKRVRRDIKRVGNPIYAFQSRHDELVSGKAVKYLARNPKIEITILEDSGHFCYDERDLKILKPRIVEIFLKHLLE